MVDSKPTASTTTKDVSNDFSYSSNTHDTSARSTKSARSKFSITSNETGESSRTGSTMNSASQDGDSYEGGERGGSSAGRHRSERDGTSDKAEPEGRNGHSGRRNIRSGGFLLSDTSFGASAALPKLLKSQRKSKADGKSKPKESSRDSKGKTKTTGHDKLPSRRKDTGSSIGNSPLAAVVNATSDVERENATSSQATGDSDAEAIYKVPRALDADSTQIVNLALNLSESRRLASRRNVSAPLPPQTNLTGEGPVAVGGSLRQHMQQSQQRRSSRNISPKSDRAVLRNLEGPRSGSPLQSAFQTHPDGDYEYHFSTSTLARAEKAKKAIELAAQYRRLLQYVPPLKPQQLARTSTVSPSGTAPSSPSTSNLPLSRTTSHAKPIRTLGRPYNPLQYIRNRKVRLRERRVLDGVMLGFDDVAKVKFWVDQVSSESADEQHQTNDCVILPPFTATFDSNTGTHKLLASASKAVNANAKGKRPRMDWTINPEDMIADVIWLEEDDNKKLIEDREGRKIFPAYAELKRPMSRESIEPPHRLSADLDRGHSESDRGYRSEGALPHFQTIQEKPELESESSGGRARRRLQNKLRIQHGHNGSHDHDYHFWHSRSRSSSSSSSSSDSSKSRRRDSLEVKDSERDILEKQMTELLAAEARHSASSAPSEMRDPKGRAIIKSIEMQKAALKDEVREAEVRAKANVNGSAKVTRDETPIKSTKSSIYSPSPRASLDVDHGLGRSSFEIFTAPSSPSIQVWGAEENFFQGIGPEALQSSARQKSPTRNPIEKARSKINDIRDRSHERGRASLEVDREPRRRSSSRSRPSESPERGSRSTSPKKKLLIGKKDEDTKGPKRFDSIRRRTDDESSSGLRGLFKSSRLDDIVRGPVSRVSDLIWKKEGGSAVTSDSSSDDSDSESDASRSKKSRSGKLSKSSTYDDGIPQKHLTEPKSFVDAMPTFTSPFEFRGRTTKLKEEEPSLESDHLHHVRTYSSRQGEKFERLKPPRIDISAATPPSSSPGLKPFDRRESDYSDLDSVRGVKGADERVDTILGPPGTVGRGDHGLMMTGLASVDSGSPQVARNRQQLSPGHKKPRQWSISDREPSVHRGAVNRQEIARVRALLLSSGVKAKEISRRAAYVSDLRKTCNFGPGDTGKLYADIAAFASDSSQLKPVPNSQQHIIAARILSQDIQASSMIWQKSANNFTNNTIPDLLYRIDEMKAKVRDGCMERVRIAGDEADGVGMEIVGEWTMSVKRLSDTMEGMLRRRRRRFRWVRRGGWMILEWVLVGVMWWVWLIVVVCKILKGSVTGVLRGVRWLLWL